MTRRKIVMEPINPQEARDLVQVAVDRRRPYPGDPITPEQIDEAAGLLVAMLTAAGRFRVSLDDWGWIGDLTGQCLDVIRRRDSMARMRSEKK